VIGVILASVAIVLAGESKGLLIGEGLEGEQLERIRVLAQSDTAVERSRRPLAMHFGPHNVMLAIDLQFRQSLTSAGIQEAIDRVEARIRGEFPQVRHIFVEAKALTGTKGQGAEGPPPEKV
jgi:divalent metal cation (Fe/Co/Zn/Cd) transporter